MSKLCCTAKVVVKRTILTLNDDYIKNEQQKCKINDVSYL